MRALRAARSVLSLLLGVSLDALFGPVQGEYVSATACECGGLGIVRSGLGGGWRACGCPAADKLPMTSDPD